MKQLWMDWQLFAEGESAPEGAGEGQDSTSPDAGEDFEALIRGRCKEEFSGGGSGAPGRAASSRGSAMERMRKATLEAVRPR